VSISICEIDPSDAPVAYRVHTQDPFSSDRLHEVRSYDHGFWWPLMPSDGPVSVPRFIEPAADGEVSSFLTFGRSIQYGREDGRSFTEFLNDFPTYRFGEPDKDVQLLKTLRDATFGSGSRSPRVFRQRHSLLRRLCGFADRSAA
jgi:hypothetical protein